MKDLELIQEEMWGINISDPSQLTNKLQVDGSVRFDNLVSSAGTENNGLLLNGLNQVVSRSFDVVAFNGEIDGDITNELQELTISNGTVGITQGNSIELPWQRNDASGEIYPNVLTDKVGIGTNNPEYDLDVQGILASTYLLPNIIDGNSNRSLRIGSTRQLSRWYPMEWGQIIPAGNLEIYLF